MYFGEASTTFIYHQIQDSAPCAFSTNFEWVLGNELVQQNQHTALGKIRKKIIWIIERFMKWEAAQLPKTV